jgi:hypothetical protein
MKTGMTRSLCVPFIFLCFCNGGGGSEDAGGDDAASDPDAPDPVQEDAGADDAPADPAPEDTAVEDMDRPDGPLTEFEQILVDLPADSWHAAAGTQMREVCVSDDLGVRGVSGCGAIVGAWGGGAYDPVHRKMIIWGGGHDDYHGNEVYAFDLPSGSWERLTDPTLPPDNINQDPLPDGNPVSRHTYDGLQYMEAHNRFFGFGGSRARDGGGTRVTWVFDVEARTWHSREPAGDPPGMGHVYNLSSAWDPVENMLYMRDPYNFYSYDHEANQWTTIEEAAHEWGQQRGAIDPVRRLHFTLGSGELLVYDLAARQDITASWTTTGGQAMIDAPAPGFDYESSTGLLVAWHGGAPWILDPETRTWSAGSDAGAPAEGVGNGTYGRWRYMALYNVFILVNSVDADVVFYKHSGG